MSNDLTRTNSGNEVTLGLYYCLTAVFIEIICESTPRAQNNFLYMSVGVDRQIW